MNLPQQQQENFLIVAGWEWYKVQLQLQNSMIQKKRTVLVVEDEDSIKEVVCDYLASFDYQIYGASNGKEALQLFRENEIDLILLDLMLPDISGEEICNYVRQRSRVPVIILTAKVGDEDLLNGFDIGADDYIRKPFKLKELKVRVEAVLRRSDNQLTPLYQKIVLQKGNLIVDLGERKIYKDQQELKLTKSEWNILLLFLKHPQKIYTREEMIVLALDEDFDGIDRSIDSHIRNLRQKIEQNPKKPEIIITVHGLGYQFGGEKDA